MTRKNTTIRMSLMATMVATALAAPAAMAGNGVPLETRPVSDGASIADQGARLIIRYRDGQAARASKLKTVDGAANRAHASRLVRNAAEARQAAPTARYMRKLAVGADLVRLSHEVDASELNALVRELKADPAVKLVEIDRMMRAIRTPAPRISRSVPVTPQLVVDDQYYATYQWHLQDTAGGINASEAWDVSTGEGVVVAVLDTGIVPHPDMDASMLPGYDFISDAEVSRRQTDDRVPGAHDYGDWEAAGECAAGRPAAGSSFHGTHVAGTIAEQSNNAIGMAGIAHSAKVLPVRVLGKCGGYTSDIADAIVWAAGGDVPGVPANEFPAEVINMSLGGEGSCAAISQTAINQAVALGTTVVVAAGNSGADAANYSPASCDNVVSVAAAGIDGARAYYSNYGAKIDLTGPGGGAENSNDGFVWQANNSSDTSPELGNPSYVGMAGTSMAAPHVAGVVALVQSAVVASGAAPKTPAEIEAILVDSARAFPATPDEVIGSGLLDAPAALAKAFEVPCDPETEQCAPDAVELTDAVAVRNLSGATGSETLYSIEVPAGSRLLNVMTYGGSGNISLYVSADEAPTAAVYDHKSSRPGNNETVRASNPAATTYYILVVGESAYNRVTIQARID